MASKSRIAANDSDDVITDALDARLSKPGEGPIQRDLESLFCDTGFLEK